MSSNRTDDAVRQPPGKGWLRSLLWFVRLLAFFVVLLAGDVVAQYGRMGVARQSPAGDADWMLIGAALVLAALLVGLYVVIVRWTEQRPARELAPGVGMGLVGIAAGLALFSTVFGLLYLIGIVRWQGVSAHFDVGPVLATSIIAAVGEELAFRGVLFRIVAERFGTAIALLASAAVFGLLHGLNPGATVVSTAAIAIEAGLLLGAAYALTRNLWFPIGLHLGWNFTEGGIFGTSVSGGSAANGIFSVSLTGPRLLSGGAFGPEASLMAIAVGLAAAVVLVVLTVRTGHWMPMQSARKPTTHDSRTTMLWAAVSLLALSLTARARAGVTPQIERAVRAATFEVVLRKPASDPLSYEKPLPLDLIPYQQRVDKYQPVGTAFALGPDTYVTAAHVLEAAVDSQYGRPALRGEDGKVYPIASILRFSADEDYAVFTLAGAPAAASLNVSRTRQLDAPVSAVGTALGEGIVIRDGLYTSDTPEDQDGRWKWIRFSAAASPGNSGGPLLDAAGKVIGIVIAKSPNENLYYALPIGLVLDAPKKALFDRRFLTELPFMQGSRVYTLKDEFALPLSWATFDREYQRVVQRHTDEARERLLAAYADSMFPLGSGANSILYSTVVPSADPGIILQQENGQWTLDQPTFDSTDLPDNGKVLVATMAGATLLRVDRGPGSADDAFYSDSKQFMDVALKGLVIRRYVGTDAVRVTSLGPALTDVPWTDRYGRKWQQRVWPLPYLDSYVVALLLPTPDGYAGVLEYSGSAQRQQVQENLGLLANQVSLDYSGTLAQWTAFLRRRALLPDALTQVSLAESPVWTLRTPRFEMTMPPELLSLKSDSPLTLVMVYDAVKPKASWDVAGAWWYQDTEQRTYVALWRQARPPATAQQQLQDAYSDMENRRSPFDGGPIRVLPTVVAITNIVQASADVVYASSIGIDANQSLASFSDRVRLAPGSVRILEHATGAAVAASAPAPDFRSELESRMEQYRDAAFSYDSVAGADIRGRTFSEDVTDYIIAVYRQSVPSPDAGSKQPAKPAPGAESFEALGEELAGRQQALQSYWKIAPVMMHNRDLWQDFLASNGLAATTQHDAQVLAAESALRAELAGGDPNPRWSELAADLRDAYVAERDLLVTHAAIRRKPLEPRLTPCPPPAPGTSGRATPAPLPLTSSLEEFYPPAMRRLGIEGEVMVRIRIDTSGCVSALGIVGSSGSDALDQAAMRMAETQAFYPAERNGHAVIFEAAEPINFKLSD
jgi:serine protease Do